MTDQATHRAISAFLAAQSTMTLATLSAAGHPMAASLFYASDDALCVYWTSGGHSRHSQNLRHHGEVALTVHTLTWDWTEITGVQMEGVARVVPAGDAWQAVWQRYLAKFPFVRDFQAEISRSNFYHFTPRWARLIDNRRGFGYREELQF